NQDNEETVQLQRIPGQIPGESDETGRSKDEGQRRGHRAASSRDKADQESDGSSQGEHQSTRETMTLFQERPIKPMMAKTGESFDSKDYFFEVKWDGLRALLFLEQGKLGLQNRNLRDVTASYPEIRGVAAKIKARKAVVDGEVVVLTERGIPDFGRMQTRFG